MLLILRFFLSWSIFFACKTLQNLFSTNKIETAFFNEMKLASDAQYRLQQDRFFLFLVFVFVSETLEKAAWRLH